MPPEKAAAEARRRMVEGIAFGSVTYEDYRAWADAPDDNRAVSRLQVRAAKTL